MNRKVIVLLGVATLTIGAFARPHHGGWHPGPRPMHYHHHYHGYGYSRCFWPSFVGGVVGGAVAGAILDRPAVVVTQPVVTQPSVIVQQPVVTQPVVVQQPVVTQTVVAQPQTVWVEGRYVDQIQANGSTIRIWQPGHYEQR